MLLSRHHVLDPQVMWYRLLRCDWTANARFFCGVSFAFRSPVIDGSTNNLAYAIEYVTATTILNCRSRVTPQLLFFLRILRINIL